MIVETVPESSTSESPAKPRARRSQLKEVSTIREMRMLIERWRCLRKTIGFIPTMGALHEGHVSLIRAARQNCDRVVVSIFVNPLQFGPQEDFASYPRDMKRDLRLVRAEKANVVFMPTVEDIYPTESDTRVVVGDRWTQTLCGATRLNHFMGVATVVTKLFNIVRPHKVYFGQKDYQQGLVVKRVVEDLNLGCEVISLPTVRESDGLAKSSRNAYLGPEERRVAPVIYQALKLAEGMLQVGERNPGDLIEAVSKRLKSESLVNIEYIATKNADTLEDLKILMGRVLVAVAVRIGKTRLIDNVVVDVPSGS